MLRRRHSMTSIADPSSMARCPFHASHAFCYCATSLHHPTTTFPTLLPTSSSTSAISLRGGIPSALATTQHSYICSGNILVLANHLEDANLPMFQRHWQTSRPVIIRDIHKSLNPTLWTPERFRQASQHLPAENNSIQDCRSGAVVANSWPEESTATDIKTPSPGHSPHTEVTAAAFWAGFMDRKDRLRNMENKPFLLKLKDWPSGDRFAETLPEHYADFCAALPMPSYTHPDSGELNLVTRLPGKIYCKPDLGPKMYTAYEMVFDSNKATTSLHLDVSDAANVMVHVSLPKGTDRTLAVESIYTILAENDVDTEGMARVRQNPLAAGALWTIWNPDDADKLRKYFKDRAAARAAAAQEEPPGKKVKTEGLNRSGSGSRLSSGSSKILDPIHDQTQFVTAVMAAELEKDYGVRGYTFVQMLGDAVFIPAGAPHQVQNLMCCIKIAEDFVTPEGARNSYKVSKEFRNLTMEHSNHEDKLQFQNILYHATRHAVEVLAPHCPGVARPEILNQLQPSSSGGPTT